MRVYGSIQIRFWENQQILQISDQAKLLAIYLLTGPHSNMIGCFRLPEGYITEDLRWDSSAVKAAFKELTEINFLTRDDDSSWLIIHHFLLWNPVQNPKQGVGVKKLFDVVPMSSTIYKALTNSLVTYGKYFDIEFANRLRSLSGKCITDKDQNNDQEQNQDQEQDQDNLSLSGKPDVISLFNKSFLETEQNPSVISQSIEVLNFLNSKTGRAYRPVEENLKFITARLKSGASVMDCRQVIAKKTREWKDDLKMAEYLRPATLFNATKFEQYMGEIVLPPEEELENGVA